MSGKLKGLVIVVAALAVGAALFLQQRQVRQLRADNERVRSQLAAAEQQGETMRTQLATTKLIMTPTGPDPELLRLRAEVARLRGVEADLARARQQTNQATAAIAPPPVQALTPADQAAAQYQQQVTTMMSGMKQIGLALRTLANDTTATDKSIVQNGRVNPKVTQALSTTENAVPVDWGNVELLVTDAADLNTVAPESIIARTKAVQTPDGKWLRVYASADGAAQQIIHQSPDEVWDGSRPQ